MGNIWQTTSICGVYVIGQREYEDLKKDAIETLSIVAQKRDKEAAHAEADAVLCDLLGKLGMADVVEVYDAVPKWYA